MLGNPLRDQQPDAEPHRCPRGDDETEHWRTKLELFHDSPFLSLDRRTVTPSINVKRGECSQRHDVKELIHQRTETVRPHKHSRSKRDRNAIHFVTANVLCQYPRLPFLGGVWMLSVFFLGSPQDGDGTSAAVRINAATREAATLAEVWGDDLQRVIRDAVLDAIQIAQRVNRERPTGRAMVRSQAPHWNEPGAWDPTIARSMPAAPGRSAVVETVS